MNLSNYRYDKLQLKGSMERRRSKSSASAEIAERVAKLSRQLMHAVIKNTHNCYKCKTYQLHSVRSQITRLKLQK